MRGRDLAAAAGIVSTATGVALIYPPAALIIGGFLLTVVAIASERNSKAAKSKAEQEQG